MSMRFAPGHACSCGEGSNARSLYAASKSLSSLSNSSLSGRVGNWSNLKATRPHAIVQDDLGLDSHIKFVTTDALLNLETPWQRCQNLPEHAFGKPTAADHVVAVSFQWHFMRHPDPTGIMAKSLKGVVARVLDVHPECPHKRLLWFIDYLSVPQFAATYSEAPMTEEEEESHLLYKKELMWYIFSCADSHVHIVDDQTPRSLKSIPFTKDVHKGDMSVEMVDNHLQVRGYLMRSCSKGSSTASSNWSPTGSLRSSNHTSADTLGKTFGKHLGAGSLLKALGRQTSAPAPMKGGKQFAPGASYPGGSRNTPTFTSPIRFGSTASARFSSKNSQNSKNTPMNAIFSTITAGDRVVSLNGTRVTTTESVEAFFRKHHDVTVGFEKRALATHSSMMGWMFMQRVMSSIVAAFHDKDELHNMVFSNKESVFVEISKRAEQFRSAARMDFESSIAKHRAEVAFEGKVTAESGKCIVSFPGAYLNEWDGLVQLCKEDQLSTACVYLPKSDPKQRFGKHRLDPNSEGSSKCEAGSKCFCHALYGVPKFWGCEWFAAWMANVEEAVQAGLELIVVFLPGQKGDGLVPWENLPLEGNNLWNKCGLGGSQKGEVAWLEKMGYAYQSMDVAEVNQHFGLRTLGMVTSSSELGGAMGRLLEELKGKVFLECLEVDLDEEATARRLLGEIVAHLSDNWHNERAARRFRRRPSQLLREYILEWESLSHTLTSKVWSAKYPDKAQLAACVLAPIMITVALHGAPLARPDEGLWANWLCLLMVFLTGWVAQSCAIVVFLQGIARVPCRGIRCVVAAALMTPVLFISSLVAVSHYSGIFPVPYSVVTLSLPAVIVTIVPQLRLCMDPEWSSCHSGVAALRKIVWSATIFGIVATTFFICLPPLVQIYASLGTLEQVCFLPVFVVLRVATEKLVEVCVRRSQESDALPYAVFQVVLCYETQIFVRAARVSLFGNLLLLVVADAFEMGYYLYSIWRLLHKDCSDTTLGARTSILATLVLRELAELLGPIYVGATAAALYLLPSRPQDALVAQLTLEEFKRWMFVLVIDVALELMVLGMVFWVLHRLRCRPLALLSGVLKAYWQEMSTAAVAVILVTFMEQVAHLGSDPRFEFKWVHDPDAKWVAGNSWE